MRRQTCSGKKPPRDPRARGARELRRAVLTGPQPQCIGLPAAEARQFFRYCLGLRGGGSSHFAPICTAKLRRDQSSGGGGWDKCTECHINHGHQGFSHSFQLSPSYTHTHTRAKADFSQQPPDSSTSHRGQAVTSKHISNCFIIISFYLGFMRQQRAKLKLQTWTR